MAEPFTIYKLTILYMLDNTDYPLSNFQIANFFLEHEYTDYFRVQQVIGDLINSGLIDFKITKQNTKYTITDEGKHTLKFLSDKLNPGIEEDVLTYFKNNKVEIRLDNAVIADYYKATGDGYAVRCQFKMKDISLIDLTLAVKTEKQAKAICDNWKKQNEDVYGYLMDILMK
jgi:DNA-binding PadR family transcriptional regulator